MVQVFINMGLGKFLNSLNTKISVFAQQLNEISTSYFRVGLLWKKYACETKEPHQLTHLSCGWHVEISVEQWVTKHKPVVI